MIFLLGSVFGSLLITYVLYALWEFALFSRIMDDPVKGKTASLMAAFVSANVLSLVIWQTIGIRDVVSDLFAVGIIGFFGIRRGIKLRDSQSETAAETFE